MRADTIVAYTYKAEILCPASTAEAVLQDNGEDPLLWTAFADEHIVEIMAKRLGIDQMDEYSFDSDEFPKVVFASQIEGDEVCGECGEELL